MATSAASKRHDRFACAHVALKQPVHRLRPLHVVHDFFQRRALSFGEPERQDLPRGFADAVVHFHHHRLGFPARGSAAHQHAQLEQKELLEDEPLLRGRPELIELIDRRAGRWKVRVDERLTPRRQLHSRTNIRRKRIAKVVRQTRQHFVHQAPLHLGRHRAGFFVDRHDPAGVNSGRLVRGCFSVRVISGRIRIDDFVVRVGELESGPRLHEAEEHHGDVRAENVLQKRLVHPDGANRAAAVADDGFENLETRPPRGAEPAALNAAGDGHLLPGLEAGNWLQMAAILVPDREAIQQILDSRQADPLQIGRALWSDAFQELKGGLEVIGHSGSGFRVPGSGFRTPEPGTRNQEPSY